MKKYIFIFILLVLLFLLANINVKSSTTINTTIKIEVRGKVDNPGIFTIKRGSTLNDLIPLIKLQNDSDISNYSLNKVLYNNEIIIINEKSKQTNKISINSASVSELTLLPGIGEATAKKIIEYRQTNGSFNSLDELKNISGIGDKKYEKLVEYITL